MIASLGSFVWASEDWLARLYRSVHLKLRPLYICHLLVLVSEIFYGEIYETHVQAVDTRTFSRLGMDLGMRLVNLPVEVELVTSYPSQ